ncbi:hypothetical protein ACIO93_02120 [Streptomyces sp. NPDC087903]|uniref:hypothetical protein n=1 Tax=Streptomyces sp. NPDC087903 TaxID=3365819 RepID=UPI0038006D0A
MEITPIPLRASRGICRGVEALGCRDEGVGPGSCVFPPERLKCRIGRPGRSDSRYRDAAIERKAQERDRLTLHVEDLLRTRDSLDALIAAAQADRDARSAV